MVCQNQSIDDSDAPLGARPARLVRERLKAGDSDQQVIDFLVARYGDFVLLRPRFTWHTALLWLMPAAVFVIGAMALVLVSRRCRSRPARRRPPASSQRRRSPARRSCAERAAEPADLMP